ncbi:MAG: UDP-glucose/GDP-mannose dehydrogenase family protein [Caulobacterales bacterium]|jgi:GDP-mannose 6-dehydrogenase|nr:UDP-glucose/GDP-mannose dehydrogenase family protein [Caulobacterales bacterium]
MKVAIIGIGYVGAVTAACLARDGHDVIAVDVNPTKVAAIQNGQAPIIEPGLPELTAKVVAEGRLRATNDVALAIAEADMCLICVGTPSNNVGGLELTYVLRVAAEIGAALKKRAGFHSVVVRSTILPGTMDSTVIPALEAASGKKAGKGFGIGYYPEFLREGTAIKDYDDPGLIVFGARDDATFEHLSSLQESTSHRVQRVEIRTAEGVKYFCNAWHALKISFANEVGNICKAHGIDGPEVMEALVSDTRLNVSKAYLRPGFAYGGSCLPKDLRALRQSARQLNVPTPVLDGTGAANEVQIDQAFQLVTRIKNVNRRVSFLGVSFKPDTDDLRESPLVLLAERLLGKGYDISIYDANVRMSRLTGANLAYVLDLLPHISRMLREDIEQVLAFSDVVIVGHAKLLRDIDPAKLAGKTIIDLAGLPKEWRARQEYYGICW